MLKNYNFNSMLSGCHAVMDRLIEDGANPEELYKSPNVADCILTIGEYYAKSSGNDEMTARAEEIKSHEHDIAETLGYVQELVDNDMGADSDATKKYNSIIGVLHDHIGRLRDADVDISISHEIDQCIESIAKVYVTDEDQIDIYDKTNNHDWADALTFLLDNLGGYDTTPDMPIAIKITKTPDKLTYHVGDNVDYTGIEVRAIGKNGKWWKNKDYPGGIIPIDELKFPDISITEYLDWTADKNIVTDADTYLGRSASRSFYKKVHGKALAMFQIPSFTFDSGGGWVGPILISTNPEFADYKPDYGGGGAGSFNYLGITWYYDVRDHYQNVDYDTPLELLTYDIARMYPDDSEFVKMMKYNNVRIIGEGERSPLIIWNYNNEQFTDYYTVTIE